MKKQSQNQKQKKDETQIQKEKHNHMKKSHQKKLEIKENIFKELYSLRYIGKPMKQKLFQRLKKEVLGRTDKKAKNITYTRFSIPKDVISELSTARNRNLITAKEQEILRKKTVAFFGMSVGSHAAVSWEMTSRADTIKIMDPDTIDATNLNRIRTGWRSVGKYKIDILKKEIQDIHPPIKVIASRRTSAKGVNAFFYKEPQPDAIVDEIDDFEAKILLRKLARAIKIPLISAADIGDNIMIDIERHDTDIDYPFFHGKIDNVEKLDFSSMDQQTKKKLIIHLIGFEYNSEKMLDSIASIGTSIPTWPQLGSTAFITGGIVSALLKKIFLGEKILSGRYYVSLDDIFVSDFQSKANIQERNQKIKNIRNVLGL